VPLAEGGAEGGGDVNFADYCQLDAVNASSLKAAAVSAADYHYDLTHERPDTAAMAKGRAIHCATLEPDEFPRRYTVWSAARRGKDWLAFEEGATDAGLEILTQAEYADVLATRDAVRAHPVAACYLDWGDAERTITWTDEATGLPCKARLDFLNECVVDLKTSRDIGDHSFSRTTHDLLYHMSAAHYLNGIKAVTGVDHPFVFIAVESNPPHDVRVGPLSEDAIYCGEQEAARLLRLVADCTASGEWPGAFPDEDTFDLPAWYYAEEERKLEGLA